MGPLYWEIFFALFMRLLRMLNIVLTIISVSTTHTILYCAATSTVLYSVNTTNDIIKPHTLYRIRRVLTTRYLFLDEVVSYLV